MLKKIKKSANSLRDIVSNPWLLNLVYDRDSAWRSRFNKSYPDKASLPVYELGNFVGSEFTIGPWTFQGEGSMPTDIALLVALTRRFEACKYFEIGTWLGESVANLAPHCHSCVSMDLPEAELKAMGVAETYIARQGMLADKLENVRLLKANSQSFDFSSLAKFDLLFIDGDHHYESVVSDTKKLMQHNVHEESIIVWHDYAFSPGNTRWEVYKAILDGLPASMHSRLVTFNASLCAVLLPQKFIDRLDLWDGSISRFELKIKSS